MSESATQAGAALSDADRRRLLGIARDAIAARLSGRRLRAEVEPGSVLAEKRGAFVTLHEAATGELRGCIGRLSSDQSLAETVASMAVAAATTDIRFVAVTADELGRLRVEISALGPLVPIRPEDVEVGRHGLVLSQSGHRGVLLPQVPVEQGWNREEFLDHTCIKAGLLPGAWREEGATLLGFTADVFGEEEGRPEPGPPPG